MVIIFSPFVGCVQPTKKNEKNKKNWFKFWLTLAVSPQRCVVSLWWGLNTRCPVAASQHFWHSPEIPWTEIWEAVSQVTQKCWRQCGVSGHNCCVTVHNFSGYSLLWSPWVDPNPSYSLYLSLSVLGSSLFSSTVWTFLISFTSKHHLWNNGINNTQIHQ